VESSNATKIEVVVVVDRLWPVYEPGSRLMQSTQVGWYLVGWLVGWLMSFASITVGLLCRMLSNCRCNSSSRLRSWLFL